MRILFISRRFYPDILGGGEVSAYYIAKAVKMQGHNVYVSTFTEKKSSTKTVEGIKIFRNHIHNSGLLKRFSKMEYMYVQMALISSKIIKKINPDVIHLLNFESIPLSAIYYKLRFKSKIVATVNGPQFGCFTGNAIDYKNQVCIKCRLLKRYMCSIHKWGGLKGFLFYLYSIWYMNMLRFSYKFVDKFFPVSNAMVPLVMNMGIPKEKITVIHNPIEIKKKVKTDLKKRLGIEGKKVILYIGRLKKEKGIHHTIKAMTEIDDAVFVIVGKKHKYYSDLKKLVEKLGLEDKVIFTGFVPNDRLVEYYSIAEVISFPCEVYESLSRMLIEGVSFGIPIVATDIGGNRDIVEDGCNGILIPNLQHKKVVKSLKKCLFRNKSELKTNALRIAYKFEINLCGKSLVSNYKNLI